MADQGIWFKLWASAYDDPDLSILHIADFGRWAKFGVYTKRHGTDGVLILTPPPSNIRHPLESAFQVETFNAVLDVVSSFKTCTIEKQKQLVSSETIPFVSFKIVWRNWRRYQGDFSSDRVKRHRAKKAQNVTDKKRREEKRQEEKEINYTPTPSAPENGFASWPPEWKPLIDRIQSVPILTMYKHWLSDLSWWQTLDELFSSCPKRLDGLLLEAAAYIKTEDYRPRTKKALRLKLRNCMEFSARRAERENQERQRESRSH